MSCVTGNVSAAVVGALLQRDVCVTRVCGKVYREGLTETDNFECYMWLSPLPQAVS